jgi:hypothetical protein
MRCWRASRAPELARPAADAGVDAVVAYFGPDRAELTRRFGADVAATVLARCVRKGDERAARCLTELAASDRAAALAALEKHAERLKAKQGRVGVAARTLLAYPQLGLHARLVADGLLPAGAKDTEREDVTAEALLHRAGRVDQFDTETDTFPNAHHVLLARLARLAPALGDVSFDEVPPPESAMDAGPYVLHAWTDGKRFTLKARNNGDWYDLEAVLGLLNALLATKGSEVRFVTLATGDQSAKVIAAPLPILERLVSDRLVTLDSSDDAMNDGKAFEEKVFRQLQKGE